MGVKLKMKRTLILLMTAAILSTGCQKELSSNKKTTTAVNLWDGFAARQPGPQLFTVTTAFASNLFGQKGTRLQIPANAFITAAGAPVTGQVNIELREIYEVWEMVLYNKFTQSGTQPIESGGEFFIRATQNGQELRLAPNLILRASLPAANPLPGMQVFYGSRFDSAGASNFSWQLAEDRITNNVSIAMDSVNMGSYLMEVDSLAWINCDRFINETMNQVNIAITNSIAGDQASVLVHFTGMRSIIQAWSTGLGMFKSSVPSRAATLIAVTNRDGQLHTAFNAVQLQAGGNYSLTLSPTTEEAFINRLKELN